MTALDLMLSVILLLLYAYIYVWSRGPRDGKLSRMIRRLRKGERYWRRRALRDEAILSRVIDKKHIALVAILCLFLIPIANPDMSLMPAARGIEPFTPLFSTAADGAESSESITSFSETSSDNVLLYPDSPYADGEDIDGTDLLQDTFDDAVEWSNYADATSISSDGDSMMWMPSGAVAQSIIERDVSFTDTLWANDGYQTAARGTFCYIKVKTNATSSTQIYLNVNGTTDSQFSRFAGLGTDGGWKTWMLYPDWYPGGDRDTTGGSVWLSWEYDAGFDTSWAIWVDWLFLTNRYVEQSADAWCHSFTNVSDWTEDGGAVVTSDGDVLSIVSDGAVGSSETTVSIDTDVANYVEVYNRVVSGGSFGLDFYTVGDGWQNNFLTLGAGWTAQKKEVNSWLGSDKTITKIRIRAWGSSAREQELDYLRIGKSTEMGWQHDGSTIEGVSNDGEANVTYTSSSDGDILTLTATRTSGSGAHYVEFFIAYDTTATLCDIERDYYPFVAVNCNITLQGGATYVNMQPNIDGKYGTRGISSVIGTFTTSRINTAPFTPNIATKYIKFYSNLDATGEGFTIELDWVKAYSIANFTVTQSGGCTTSDVAYVENNALKFSRGTYEYMTFDYDPALSTATGTYNVWNWTVSDVGALGGSYDWALKFYVAGAWEDYVFDITRGACVTTGTLTDWKFINYDSITISAIKFIEDATAPDILDKYLDPSIPADDEAVTITTVAYDAIEVYEVTINAVVYPTGFSDVDYEMTETAQEHVFTYDFDTLTAGYYLFQIEASDGANTYSEYISVRVRVAEIVLSPITFFGVGEDFTQMQMSFDINKDCTYTIYEASASSAESDTHTGSVSEGWSNIAWDKISVTDTSANFSIKFVNGSLSTWINGSYSIAQTTFYVDAGQVESLDTVTVAGRISKLGAWQLYDENNILKDTGSITDLDFTIRFTKWSGYDEQNHDFAIKFTNGSQSCWYNSSYYAFKKPAVAAVATTDKNTLYAYQASFWTGVMVVFILAMVAIDFKRRYWK